MGTLFIALRTLVYVTAFVGFFAWLALRVRLLDQRLGLKLPSWVQGPGVILMVAGGVLVLMCAVQFVWRGGGTPAVFDAPRRFVGSGPYRFVRNPMYLGGLTTLAGLGLFLHSGAVLIFSGAMFLALGAIRARNGNRPVPYYAHPGMFHSRAMRLPNGELRRLDDVPGIDDLTAQGAQIICTTEPQSFLDDTFFVSGEIPRVTEFERGLPGQVRKTADGKGWEPDELLMDERWIAAHIKDKGLFVFSACSHAGIINVLKHAQAGFPDVPLYGVMGGLHLSGANEKIIPQTIEAMKEFQLATIAAGHCTGWRAMAALSAAFGDKILAPTAVGKRYTF